MIDQRNVSAFLAGRRIAVVGASDAKQSFGRAVYVAMRDHGYEVVAVNPNATEVAGDPCVPNLSAVDGDVDGVVLMTNATIGLDVVREAIALGIPRVWLFKGIGAPGSVSDEAVRLCEDAGVDVIAGACPLMFLEPVGAGHRAHRFFRRLNGSVSKAA